MVFPLQTLIKMALTPNVPPYYIIVALFYYFKVAIRCFHVVICSFNFIFLHAQSSLRTLTYILILLQVSQHDGYESMWSAKKYVLYLEKGEQFPSGCARISSIENHSYLSDFLETHLQRQVKSILEMDNVQMTWT